MPNAPVMVTVPKDAKSSPCHGCGAVIYWVRTANGKNMPVDTTVEGGLAPLADRDGRGVSHFATCPKADPVSAGPDLPHQGGSAMSKARKPRIITETVQRLRALAKDVREFGVVDDERHARVIDNIATGLDAHDARETRLDPSRRKRKVRRA